MDGTVSTSGSISRRFERIDKTINGSHYGNYGHRSVDARLGLSDEAEVNEGQKKNGTDRNRAEKSNLIKQNQRRSAAHDLAEIFAPAAEEQRLVLLD